MYNFSRNKCARHIFRCLIKKDKVQSGDWERGVIASGIFFAEKCDTSLFTPLRYYIFILLSFQKVVRLCILEHSLYIIVYKNVQLLLKQTVNLI